MRRVKKKQLSVVVRKQSEETAGKKTRARTCVTPERTSTPKKKTRAHHRHSVERFGARDAGYVRAKCRFARSFVAMSRSPLAFAAGLACVFVLTFAPRADAWNPNPSKLLPYEHCTGEGGECTCHGIARWGWPMDTEKHPEYEDGYQWVRPPPNAPRTRLRLARSLKRRLRRLERQHPRHFRETARVPRPSLTPRPHPARRRTHR